MEDSIEPAPWKESVEGGPIRFAVVGVGAFAKEHILPAMRASERCQPAVLVSPDLDPTRADADQIVLSPAAYQDGEASEMYDAVFIATPNHKHKSSVTAAASFGKPILCEKPLAPTSKEARQIQQVCAAAEVPLMVGYRCQFKPPLRALRDSLNDGLIGDVIHAHSAISFQILDQDGKDQWRLSAAKGGGVLRDIGIYPINTLRFVLGEPLSAVWASLSSGQQFSEIDIHAAFALESEGGVSAVCSASFASEPSSSLRLTGTDGIVTVANPYHPSDQPSVTIQTADATRTVSSPEYNEYQGELEYFAGCLLRDGDPDPDAQQAIADLAVIETIEQLANQNSAD